MILKKQSSNKASRLNRGKIWPGVLLLAALFARVYAALYHTHSADPDVPINALMVQHVAEGRHYPTIYYNESYVGTLEVYIGAVFQRFLPHPVTPSLLGYGLVSWLALPFFYLWARKTAGAVAALAGLALLVVGPVDFIFRNVFIGSPTALFCGMAACWLTLRIRETSQTGPPPARALFFLGLVAGIGWWTQAIVLAYLLPCALVLALSVSWRQWLRAGCVALPGLLLGAAPWILFTLRETEALGFVTNVAAPGEGSFLQNIGTAYHYTLELYRTGLSKGPLFPMTMLALLLLVAAGIPTLASARKRGDLPARILPWLMLLSTFALCGVSRRFGHVPATRYLLPVVPALALLAGMGVAWLASRASRAPKILAPALLLLALAGEYARLPKLWSPQHQQWIASRQAILDTLGELCDSGEIEVLHGGFFKNWITGSSHGRLPVVTWPYRFDRYRPYRGAASLTDRPGVINDHHGFLAFLRDTGATSRNLHTHGLNLAWNPQKSPQTCVPLSPTEIVEITWESGEPAWELADGNLDTPLSEGHLQETRFRREERTLLIKLARPRRVSGLYAWGPSGTWGRVTGVTALRGKEEIPLVESGRPAGWFWSEGRALLYGPLAHYQTRFSPVETDTLRVRVLARETDLTSLVTQLQVRIASDSPRTTHVQALPDLLEHIRETAPARFYAPRRVAEEARVRLPEFPGILPPDLYEQYEGRDRHPFHPVVWIQPESPILLVLPQGAEDASRTRLKSRGWEVESPLEIGPWTLLQARPGPETSSVPNLYWTEQGVFLGRNWFPPQAELDGFIPLLEGTVRFAPGKALNAVHLERDTVRSGETFDMVCDWECLPGIFHQHWAVFVHFRLEGKTFFQDDHNWLPTYTRTAIDMQPEGWSFREIRQVQIPEDLPPGMYSISLGLYNPRTGKRLQPRGSDQVRRRAVVFPDSLRVEP